MNLCSPGDMLKMATCAPGAFPADNTSDGAAHEAGPDRGRAYSSQSGSFCTLLDTPQHRARARRPNTVLPIGST